MEDSNGNALAEKVYEDLCGALSARNWKYKRFRELMSIHFGSIGEDLPMDFIITVDSERELIRVHSMIPVDRDPKKRLDLAIAACAATNVLADGSFDYDISDGSLAFRLTASFRGSTIGEGLFDYIVKVSCVTVDEYNDKFFAISKGVMSVDDFLETLP